jgi:hypothetical protein
MDCDFQKFPKITQNTVHFAGYGAFKVHRSLDFVTSTGPIREATDRAGFVLRMGSRCFRPRTDLELARLVQLPDQAK